MSSPKDDVTLLGSIGLQNKGRVNMCAAPSAASATWTRVLDKVVVRTTRTAELRADVVRSVQDSGMRFRDLFSASDKCLSRYAFLKKKIARSIHLHRFLLLFFWGLWFVV